MSDDISGGGGGLAILDQPADPAPEPTPPANNRRRKVIALIVIAVLLLLVLAAFAWYLITRKPITALPGLSNEAMPRFSYAIYNVTQPMGVAVNDDGSKVYVTQAGGDRSTILFDHTGKQLAKLTPPKSTGPNHVPVYVAINPTNHNVYVTDRMTGSIYVYTENGTYLHPLKPKSIKGIWMPLGLTFAPDGTLYVGDVAGAQHRVLEIDSTGTITQTFTVKKLALNFPNGMAVDADGHLLVADSNNGRLLAFDKDGKVIASVNRGAGEGDLGLPRGVAVDDSGRIFVVDTTNQSVHVYRLNVSDTTTFTFVGAFGDEGITDGAFAFPNGAASDNRAEVYITDRENGRVQVWSF